METESLGEYLRSERERKGITIEQVASSTKINVKLLYALEADRYSDLPAFPFTRGFVISYIKFIGLPVHDVLAQFEAELQRKCEGRERRATVSSGYAFEKRDTDRSRAYLMATLVGFTVIGGLSYYVVVPIIKKNKVTNVEKLRLAKNEEKKKKKAEAISDRAETSQADANATSPDESKKLEVSAKPEQPVKSPEPEPKPEKEKKEPPTVSRKSLEPSRQPAPEDPLNKGDMLKPEEILERIVFKTLAPIWVRYQVDERPVMKFKLEPQKMLVLRAKSSILVQLSNPKSVEYRRVGYRYSPVQGSNVLAQKEKGPVVVLPENHPAERIAQFLSPGPLPSSPDPGAVTSPEAGSTAQP